MAKEAIKMNSGRYSFLAYFFLGFLLFIVLGSIYLLASKVQKIEEKQVTRSFALGGTDTSLSFSPSSLTVAANDSFTVEGLISTGNNWVTAAELYIQFNPANLSVQSVDLANGFLSDVIVNNYNNTTGLITLALGSGGTDVPRPTPAGKIGSGRLFTITFLAKTAVASQTISFSNSSAVAAFEETGNVIKSKTPATVKICSATAPAVPTVTGSAPCTNNTKPSWSWTSAGTSCSPNNYYLDLGWIPNPAGQDYDETLSTTSWTADTDLATGTYGLKVRTVNAASLSSAFSSFVNVSVDTSAPTVPTLSSPADNFFATSLPVTLVTNATTDTGCGNASLNYRFQVSSSTDFTSPVHASSWQAGTTYQIPAGSFVNGVYYWRVQAKDSLGNTSSSVSRRLSLGNATFTFKIKFQGITGQGPNKNVSLIFKKTGQTDITLSSVPVSSDASGNYSGNVSGLAPDTYDVYVKGWAHLTKKVVAGQNFAAGANGTFNWTSASLLTGDIVDNNKVDLYDYSVFVDQYGSRMTPGTNADLNADNQVGIFDYSLLVPNYGTTGE